MVDSVLHLEGELDVVNPGEVDASGWLGFFGVKCGAPAIDEGVWDVRVVLVGLHEAEVASLFWCEARQVVKLQGHELDGVFEVLACVTAPVVDVLLTLSAHGPDELNDRVVEVEAHAYLAGTRGDLICLNLRDELLERTRRETVALVDVEVDVCRLDLRAEILLN